MSSELQPNANDIFDSIDFNEIFFRLLEDFFVDQDLDKVFHVSLKFHEALIDVATAKYCPNYKNNAVNDTAYAFIVGGAVALAFADDIVTSFGLSKKAYRKIIRSRKEVMDAQSGLRRQSDISDDIARRISHLSITEKGLLEAHEIVQEVLDTFNDEPEEQKATSDGFIYILGEAKQAVAQLYGQRHIRSDLKKIEDSDLFDRELFRLIYSD